MKYLPLIFLLFASVHFCWGAYSPDTIITDPAGTNQAAVKAASTAPVGTDPALVVTVSPNTTLALPTGSATSALQTTGNTALTSILAALPASLGQKAMANSLACTLASDQSSIPVTGTFWQATQPVSGTFWQATQPVSGTFWQATQPVSIAAAIPTKAPINSTAAFSQTSVTTTASTISAPSNAVRVVIQGDANNTDCIRYRFDGTAATSSVGMVAQPGQDSGQLDSGMSVSVASCSGTQVVNVQYFAQ